MNRPRAGVQTRTGREPRPSGLPGGFPTPSHASMPYRRGPATGWSEASGRPARPGDVAKVGPHVLTFKAAALAPRKLGFGR